MINSTIAITNSTKQIKIKYRRNKFIMIDKRLINNVKGSKKYIFANVFFQWISLIANIFMLYSITNLIGKLYENTFIQNDIYITAIVCMAALIVRIVCSMLNTKMSYLSSKSVKITLRNQIYKKLLKLGSSYKNDVNTSEIVQVAVEGVEQLETYFGSYLPQFFYAMLAPITLFCILAPINLKAAIVLLICVPLIPISIALVQTWAKKLLSRYWGQYTALGDNFLENLQGLTTLKIYQADEYKHRQMNNEAEKFRQITMKVLRMQLNSIAIMDLVAYGGAAAGVIISISQLQIGSISLSECILIILLSAEFFLPMRLLGSFFHIAMNGMAASSKIFKLLDLPECTDGTENYKDGNIELKNVTFSYDKQNNVLNDINIIIKKNNLTAIVGKSGCGKSTISSILVGKNKDYKGLININNIELSSISEQSRMANITYIGHNAYLFKGTIKDNLLIAKPNASDEELLNVLKRVNLYDFLAQENGLETLVSEKGSNFSGGQCQRIALARALLHDSAVYIFDEATSNIDVESENDIMAEIKTLAKDKTIILISHRLANVVDADNIYVLNNGTVVENGNHLDLLKNNRYYTSLWNAQKELEDYRKEAK